MPVRSHRVPAILEYLPYRKDDATAAEDASRHPYFAAHGFAGVRVDLRGTGDSDGVCLGEYLAQEQADALEVLAWLEAQPWCTRRGRDDRLLVGRLQRAPGRGAQAATTQGGRDALLDR